MQEKLQSCRNVNGFDEAERPHPVKSELSQMREELRNLLWPVTKLNGVCVQWCLPRTRAPAPPLRVANVLPAPSPSEQKVKPLPVRPTVTPKKEAPFGSSPWSSQKSPSCDADNLTRDTVHVSRKVINYVLVPTLSPCISCLECRPHSNWTQRTRPTCQKFPQLQRVVQAWWVKLQRTQR